MLVRAAILAMGFLATAGAAAAAADPVEQALEARFLRTVQPFLEAHCLDCHSGSEPDGSFDLSPYRDLAGVVRDHPHWAMVLDQLREGQMPPKKAKVHPTAEARQQIVAWIEEVRRHEAEKNAGDPGPVLARRLSHAEYDYTVRDLTGHDLRPTREFPVDPANQAGFDNSGESLTLSPALLKKYLQAARSVAEHAYFHLDGLGFAPHPMMADTDRDKYFVLRIVDFYQRQPTDLADYFAAAWRFEHRAALGQRRASLDDIARQAQVSPAYLAKVWATLNDPHERVGPIFRLQQQWRALPAPRNGEPATLRAECEALRDFVVTLRAKLVPEVPNLTAPGINHGAQAFVLWKDRMMAANRRRYDPSVLQVEGQFAPSPEPSPEEAKKLSRREKAKLRRADPDLAVPADPAERARLEAAIGRFADVFPDAFYVSERSRIFLDDEDESNKGRLLSAGFHSMTGYFRDDGPLYDLVLDDAGRRELDRLWNEFEQVASVPHRMHASMIWFERTDSRFMIDAEFDFARAEDKTCSSPEKVRQLAEVYFSKAQKRGASPAALAAIREHFVRVEANVARVDRARTAAEAAHLRALGDFAERAYRRPLAPGERDDVVAFYRRLRSEDGLEHEDAVRDTLVSILMSPHFLYRVDLAETAGHPVLSGTRSRPAAGKVRSAGLKDALPLSEHGLANRLSYFLWSSLPDAELLARADAGDLGRPAVLAAQARRMLRDPKARALAVEFGGHWLDFRRFEEHNAVDRERFPTFDDALRQAMFEEPVRYLLDVFQQDRPVLELLYGDHTFVNAPLARHYGLDAPTTSSNDWVRVDGVAARGRGGLLPMGVFLTRNSPGLRTSPVKRGYWVVKHLLGEHIPAPPATVPELPADEAHLGEMTLRETLERHRADPSCASCHRRFDSMGLVFEGFGPVGERRDLDLGGKPIDNRAEFPDGSSGSGLAGLQAYLRAQREDDFLDQLNRKLLAYALGRTLLLSDEPLLRELRRKRTSAGPRFADLVEGIVTSPQFLNKRGPDHLATR